MIQEVPKINYARGRKIKLTPRRGFGASGGGKVHKNLVIIEQDGQKVEDHYLSDNHFAFICCLAHLQTDRKSIPGLEREEPVPDDTLIYLGEVLDSHLGYTWIEKSGQRSTVASEINKVVANLIDASDNKSTDIREYTLTLPAEIIPQE